MRNTYATTKYDKAHQLWGNVKTATNQSQKITPERLLYSGGGAIYKIGTYKQHAKNTRRNIHERANTTWGTKQETNHSHTVRRRYYNRWANKNAC